MAACIKAETGVGPSIASGSHVCKPIWADFPTAPINKNKHIKFKLSNWNWKKFRVWPWDQTFEDSAKTLE